MAEDEEDDFLNENHTSLLESHVYGSIVVIQEALLGEYL